MGNLHIVTGYNGSAHVTAADSGSLNAAIFGAGQYVLDRGNKFSASATTSNNIRVLDGDIMMQGRHIRLAEDSYVDLNIDTGINGQRRNDLIVARYTKDSSSGVEDCSLVVIKGTSAASNPTDPSYTAGDIINDHVYLADMPLYRVSLNGINIESLTPLFGVGYPVVSVKADMIETGAITTDKFAANAKAPSAEKLATERTITIMDADGSSAGASVSFDGSGNIVLKLPATIKAQLVGLASQATKLATARNIGNAAFDGSSAITLSQIGALPASGGTVSGALALNGKLTLKSTVQYGDALPASGTAGQIFFKKA